MSSREDARPRDEAELLTAAMRALSQDYEQLNWAVFGSALRPIPLVLGEARTRLGGYFPDPRRIEISRRLLLDEPWGAVLEVLKHEMAHQYVDEVLRVTSEQAHGPAFQRACRERGIDARASGVPVPTEREPPILKRIAKLLALAQSPNPHEAEAAMRTAHRLMLKHNLAPSPADAERAYGYRHLGKPTGRSSEAERALAGLLGEFFFVQPIWVSVFRVADQKRAHVLEITGREENLAMAEYVYHFLRHAAESLWRAHKQQHGITRNTDRRAYQAGVMRGFADKLRTERTAQRGVGLIWVGDPAADAHFARRHPRVRTTRGRAHGQSAAAGHGRSAGRELVLHRPLPGSAPTNRGRSLPP